MDDISKVIDDRGPDSCWPPGLEQEPPIGAHLTTSRRGYSHHGVYVGRGTVVHYSGLSGGFWQCGPVEEVSLSRFAIGRTVRIAGHPNSPFSPEEIVRRARSRLGENDYRLLTNNCEHFCNWCHSGVSHSAQVQRPFQLPFRMLGALFHT
jgi:lecithin:retinol acyltransferase